MNYLKLAIDKLKLDGVYYTPKKILDKLNTDCIIGNPPFKH